MTQHARDAEGGRQRSVVVHDVRGKGKLAERDVVRKELGQAVQEPELARAVPPVALVEHQTHEVPRRAEPGGRVQRVHGGAPRAVVRRKRGVERTQEHNRGKRRVRPRVRVRVHDHILRPRHALHFTRGVVQEPLARLGRRASRRRVRPHDQHHRAPNEVLPAVRVDDLHRRKVAEIRALRACG